MPDRRHPTHVSHPIPTSGGLRGINPQLFLAPKAGAGGHGGGESLEIDGGVLLLEQRGGSWTTARAKGGDLPSDRPSPSPAEARPQEEKVGRSA